MKTGALTRLVPAPLRRRLGRLPAARRLRNRLYAGPQRPGPGPGELRPVVYLPTWASWERMRQRPHYVLEEFARRGHPVYFVDPDAQGPQRAGNVTVLPSLAGLPATGVLIYAHYAPVHPQIRLFDDAVVVYDITDDLSIYAGSEGAEVTGEARRHHLALVEIADVVAAASTQLADRYRPDRPDLVVAPNGVDPDLFGASAPRPGDLPAADPARPIAGYHGAIADWRFDWDLFAAVADALPSWWFALVGPVDERDAGRAGHLAGLPNVLMLGERGGGDLAGYVQSFDVGTMWYPLNPVTAAAAPMKVYEYLAAGKPVVTAPLPALENIHGVHLANGADEFVAELRAAQEESGRPDFAAAAAATAAAASWEHRLAPLFAALEGKLRAR